MELRIYASDPGFEEVSDLVNLIAKFSNPCLFVDLSREPEAECKAFVRELEDMFEELSH